MGTTLHPHLTPPHPLRSTTIDNIFRATYTVSTADGAWREQIFERGASVARAARGYHFSSYSIVYVASFVFVCQCMLTLSRHELMITLPDRFNVTLRHNLTPTAMP